MTDDLLPPLALQIVRMLARKGLTAVAAWLVAQGVLTGDGLDEQFVTVGAGLAVGAVSVGWSLWSKHADRRRVREALAVVPPGAIGPDMARQGYRP